MMKHVKHPIHGTMDVIFGFCFPFLLLSSTSFYRFPCVKTLGTRSANSIYSLTQNLWATFGGTGGEFGPTVTELVAFASPAAMVDGQLLVVFAIPWVFAC